MASRSLVHNTYGGCAEHVPRDGVPAIPALPLPAAISYHNALLVFLLFPARARSLPEPLHKPSDVPLGITLIKSATRAVLVQVPAPVAVAALHFLHERSEPVTTRRRMVFWPFWSWLKHSPLLTVQPAYRGDVIINLTLPNPPAPTSRPLILLRECSFPWRLILNDV